MTAPLRRNGFLVTTITKSCEKKQRYPDEFTARAAGMIDQEKYQVKMYMYPCGICKGWHLTKAPQRKDRHHVDFEYPAARRGD